MVRGLSKDKLAIMLEETPPFPNPRRELEQYPTPGEIAADLVLTAFFKGDIEGKIVVDLGAGTGRLGYAAALLGARHVIMVEIDENAAEASRRFLVEKNMLGAIDHIVSDAMRFRLSRRIDTVLQNPPFGHIRRHADVRFLEAALSMGNTVYSLHSYNPGSRSTLCRIACRHGFTCTIISSYRFPLRAMYREHYKRLHYVNVDAYMFRRMTGSAGGRC